MRTYILYSLSSPFTASMLILFSLTWKEMKKNKELTSICLYKLFTYIHILVRIRTYIMYWKEEKCVKAWCGQTKAAENPWGLFQKLSGIKGNLFYKRKKRQHSYKAAGKSFEKKSKSNWCFCTIWRNVENAMYPVKENINNPVYSFFFWIEHNLFTKQN